MRKEKESRCLESEEAIGPLMRKPYSWTDTFPRPGARRRRRRRKKRGSCEYLCVTNVFFTHFTSIHPSLCPPPALLVKQQPVVTANTKSLLLLCCFYTSSWTQIHFCTSHSSPSSTDTEEIKTCVLFYVLSLPTNDV